MILQETNLAIELSILGASLMLDISRTDYSYVFHVTYSRTSTARTLLEL